MKVDNDYKKEWWRGTTVYQIYPRSFFDSNGDGIGDIPGIISKLDYIRKIGFETIWISPFFKSPQRDFGYDISDYFSVSPEYGTMSDVDKLIEEIHKRDMYVIFDMVLNHTSDQHPWFIESRSSRNNPKRDWYVWKDPKNKKGRPPTNWNSQTGGSGWQWDEKTSQYYWTAFLPFQPDLNYRNPDVKKEIFKMLNFWLNKGVDGFRLDIIGSIYEDREFRDSPFIWQIFPDESNKGMLFKSKCMTENLPESIEFTKELRNITDQYDNPERFMVGETFGSPKDVAKFCQNHGLHSGFAFKCTETSFTASNFYNLIKEYEETFAYPLLPVWAFSNHDRNRRFSALGNNIKKAKLNAAFQLTARGVPFFYYGEEIGMQNAKLNYKDSLDPVSFPFKRLPSIIFKFINKKFHGAINRDLVRTPMQWNSSDNAGFCPKEVEPWLSVNNNYSSVNVENAELETNSILNCIKRFTKIRSESEILKYGKMTIVKKDLLPLDILVFKRSYKNEDIYVYLNFGNTKKKLSSIKIISGSIIASTEINRSIEFSGILELQPFEVIAIKTTF